MNRAVRVLVTTLALAFVALPACKGKSAPEKADEPRATEDGGEAEHDELPKVVKLDPEPRARAGIRSEPAKKETLAKTLTLSGEIVADPDRTAKVSSPVAGRLERVAMREGAVVKKGDVLAELRVPDLGRARGALLSATAKAKAARANEARLKGLFESKMTSEQSYLDAKAEADARDAESRALAVELSGLGAGGGEGGVLLALRAPVAGSVVARDAVVGQPVAPEQVLGQITDLAQVWFLGRVFEQDLSSLTVGAKADVVLNAFPRTTVPGVVEAIGQKVDPGARTVVARIRLENPSGNLRLGLFGKGLVAIPELAAAEPVLVVARSAVVDVAGKSVVFVEDSPGSYTRHDVTLGLSAPGKVQVLGGLREGEAVVVAGVFTLKSVLLKGSMAEDD
ncbi:MAG: efflux RND transporter periplasmic adaptor subunit [Myxococcales bacterium]|nr:efflux RND transporter periplasmic adaptor subunit [Myxococcales bacterium]